MSDHRSLNQKIGLGRIARIQPWYILTRYPGRFSKALFAFINSVISMGIMGLAAWYTEQPLVFPSLGPSAFTFFFRPSSPSSSPRNAILAHGSGFLIGYCGYHFIGQGFGTYLGAIISLGLVAVVMILGRISHPPAASTTLIVSLGLMITIPELIAILVAVLLLTIQAYIINRLSGIAYPLWRGKEGGEGGISASALEVDVVTSQSDVYRSVADRITSRKKIK